MNTLKNSMYMFSLTFSVILFIILIDYIIAYIKHLPITNLVGLEVNFIDFLTVLVIFVINFTYNIIFSNDKN